MPGLRASTVVCKFQIFELNYFFLHLLDYVIVSLYNFLINISYHTIAPVAAPQNVNATSYTHTTINVCFEFPEGSTQNGLITSFNVSLVGSPFDTESQTISIPTTSTNYPLTGSLCSEITGLQEYNNYTITLLLINQIGAGPSSASIDVQALAAGK